MILPQLEGGYHGTEVVGMFFFDDNTFVLRADELLLHQNIGGETRGSRTDTPRRTIK